jgi:transcriptional regulator with XRE-family HTH domain
MSDPDLSLFDLVNSRPGKKLTWDERVDLIKKQFPQVLTLNWKKAFDNDLDLFAWIMQDVLKADAAEPGRSGPKPRVDYRQGASRYRQMMGDDYSMLPFPEAFSILAGDRSLSSLAAKTGISRSQVRRLLRGEVLASSQEMEQVARGFQKSPGYFADYRRGVVLAAIYERLVDVPEASVKYWSEIASAA